MDFIIQRCRARNVRLGEFIIYNNVVLDSSMRVYQKFDVQKTRFPCAEVPRIIQPFSLSLPECPTYNLHALEVDGARCGESLWAVGQQRCNSSPYRIYDMLNSSSIGNFGDFPNFP